MIGIAYAAMLLADDVPSRLSVLGTAMHAE